MSTLYPVGKVSPDDTKLEMSCRTVKPLLVYFEEKFGREELEKFIFESKMNLGYLENMNNWVSYNYFCRLLARLVEYTGDSRSPFIVGACATRRECYGAIGTFFTRLGTPLTTYKLLAQYAQRCVKLGQMLISEQTNRSCVITAKYVPSHKQDKNNCLNLQGILASIPVLWGLPLAKVRERACATEEGGSCVYEVSWQNRPRSFGGLVGLLGGLVLAGGVGYFVPTQAGPWALIGIPVVGHLVGRIRDYRKSLKDTLEVNERESRDLLESVETIEELNTDLQQKVERRTEELQQALAELQDSQEQLVQSEKMATVGRLAAGMAHELNNPVGAVRNYIQDVLEDVADDSLRKRLEKAEKATGRCKRIVADLLTFARESKKLEMVDINDLLKSTIATAGEEISNPKIDLAGEFASGVPSIKIDRAQIQQMFMNIVMNAADAVNGDGRITVETMVDGDGVRVDITDNGEGVDESIQDRIFDPFFSTKSPSKGKGLGLAISYNIVKRFRGEIAVRSEKGKGATFSVRLPANGGAQS